MIQERERKRVIGRDCIGKTTDLAASYWFIDPQRCSWPLWWQREGGFLFVLFHLPISLVWCWINICILLHYIGHWQAIFGCVATVTSFGLQAKCVGGAICFKGSPYFSGVGDLPNLLYAAN